MSSLKERTIEKVSKICRTQAIKLFEIWEEMGLREEVLVTYSDQIENHIRALMTEMVNESIQKKEEILNNVKVLAQTARKLSKELGSDFESDCGDLALIEVERNLKTQVDKLLRLKEQRLMYIQELKSQELEICQMLGAKPVGLKAELPSEQEIKQFELYLGAQENEKNRLVDLFKETRRTILKLMEELQIGPSVEFEKIVCHDYSNFIYSPSNMTKLRDLRDRLKNQIEQNKALVEEKRESLMALWNYIEEPEDVRESFLRAYSGFSSTTLNALNAEIKRCQEKRSENISKYVSKVREELKRLWDMCKISDQERKTFAPLYCQSFTEDLLALHEMEETRLRKFYNNNKKIFELFAEWETQWQKMKDLDQRANDPVRYHNRGGQLLMEEKERKATEKKLPKLENQLLLLVNEYEERHKTPFKIRSMSVADYINNAREEYEEEKENLKQARKQAKDKSIKKTPLSNTKRTPGAMSMLRSTPGTSMMRGTPGTSMMRVTPGTSMMRGTPGSSIRVTPLSKRKLPFEPSPNCTVQKKQLMSTEKPKTTVLCNKVRRSGKLTRMLNGSANKLKKSPIKKKRKSKDDSLLSVSSYTKFQEHLNQRDELRSSMLPEELLKNSGTPSNLKLKTPIKPVRRKVCGVTTPNSHGMSRSIRGTPVNAKGLLPPPRFPAV